VHHTPPAPAVTMAIVPHLPATATIKPVADPSSPRDEDDNQVKAVQEQLYGALFSTYPVG